MVANGSLRFCDALTDLVDEILLGGLPRNRRQHCLWWPVISLAMALEVKRQSNPEFGAPQSLSRMRQLPSCFASAC